MFRLIINEFDVWQLFLIIFLLLFFSSLIGSFVAKQLVHAKAFKDLRSMDSILSIMGSGYSVFLGFAIIALWNHFLNVNAIVYQEADELSVINRNLTVFPDKERIFLTNALKQYVNDIRIDEWKAMRKGKESEKAWGSLNALFIAFQQFSPQSEKQKFFYHRTIKHLDEALKLRRNRLLAIKSILSEELRFALVLGAVVILFLAGLLKADGGRITILANSCLATIIAFNLTLALSFDYPFSGSISVSNSAFYQGSLK